MGRPRTLKTRHDYALTAEHRGSNPRPSTPLNTITRAPQRADPSLTLSSHREPHDPTQQRRLGDGTTRNPPPSDPPHHRHRLRGEAHLPRGRLTPWFSSRASMSSVDADACTRIILVRDQCRPAGRESIRPCQLLSRTPASLRRKAGDLCELFFSPRRTAGLCGEEAKKGPDDVGAWSAFKRL